MHKYWSKAFKIFQELCTSRRWSFRDWSPCQNWLIINLGLATYPPISDFHWYMYRLKLKLCCSHWHAQIVKTGNKTLPGLRFTIEKCYAVCTLKYLAPTFTLSNLLLNVRVKKLHGIAIAFLICPLSRTPWKMHPIHLVFQWDCFWKGKLNRGLIFHILFSFEHAFLTSI